MTAQVKKPMEGVLRKLRHVASRIPSRAWTGIAVIGFAAIGTILIVSSHAATPTSNYEAEAGTRSGNASVVSDSGASDGSGVKFSSTAATSNCDVPDRVTVTTTNKSSYPAYPLGTKLYVPMGPDP